MSIRRLHTRKTALAAAAILALGAAPLDTAWAAACTFNPASGNWNVQGNWSCNVVPSGPAGDSATIGAGKTVTVNDARSIATLTNAGTVQIDAAGLSLQGSTTNTGGVINIAAGSVLSQLGGAINGGSINTVGTGALVVSGSGANAFNGVTLGGRMDMSSVANSRQLLTGGLNLASGSIDIANGGILNLWVGDQALSGSGSLNLNDAGARLALEGTSTTTLGANVVVRGQGNIGQAAIAGGTHHLTNNGRISADVNGSTLSIVAGAGSGSIINRNLIDARNGGILNFSAVGVDNSGGLINAQTGSVVLHSGGTISGGTLGSAGSGVFRASSNGSNGLAGVTLTGVIDMTTVANSREFISGGMALSGGTVNIGNGGILSIGGSDQSLSGTGIFKLTDAGARFALEGNSTTTLGAGVVLRGQGSIGQANIAGGTHHLVNNGLISADVSGGTLNIVPGAGSGSVTNNGILEATGGGRLLLSTHIIGNSGSEIRAAAGSTVVQNGVTVSGRVNTTGAGVFSANANGSNVLQGVALNGVLDMASIANARETVAGGLTLTGSVNIGSSGILSISGGDQALAGSGSFNLDGPGSRFALEGNSTTTLGANLVLRGQGNIGQPNVAGGTHHLVNNGRISADVDGGTLNIVPGGGSGSVTNNGILEATGGGRLLLSTHIIGNPSGEIRAGSGSTVVQNGVTVSGIVNTTGAGLFSASASGNNVLQGVTLNGVLDMSGVANARDIIAGGFTLGSGGNVNIGNGGILSISGGNQTLGGTGSFNLNDGGARFALEGNSTTTLGAGVVLRGQGNIGQAAISGGTHHLVNDGRISADVNAGTLTIVAGAGSGSVTNRNLIDARNGGTLTFSNVDVDNSGGLIQANIGSVVQHSGGTISGGTLGSAGSGVFRAASNGNNVLSAVTLTGVIDMTTVANSREVISNGMALSGGRVDIGNGGILSINAGNQLLSGTGTFNLNDSGARLALEGNSTTTLGANVTVRGQGNIGQAASVGGTHHLINQGSIVGDGGVLNIVRGAGGGDFSNHGLVRATTAGTVNLAMPISGTGTLQVNPTGTLNLANGGNSQGTLTMGAAGSALNIGNANLVLGTDYTNAAAGTGNGFNRRAGVTGAGQIVAGGNAAQAITGANVSGGSTPNATLTINNVRVGTTTFNYQIANTGTTGPTLRGAIQTTANGANLSDNRLGGAGVGPGNYSAGVPGANSGNLGVTFTAAAAGPLNPLTGQVLNLRSNFENITDQKLAIVLAPGAAAFNPAIGSASPAPTVNLGSARVNSAQFGTQFTISNGAAAGAFSEDLNASFGGTTGGLLSGGGVTGLQAGFSSTPSAMQVFASTATAGPKSGTVTINYQTAGAVGGVSNGLGTAPAGSEVITVNGNVFQVAQPSPSALPATFNLGNFHAGAGAQLRPLLITNTAVAPAGFQEGLTAITSGATGQATGSGFTNVAAGLSGALNIGLTGINAGLNTGTLKTQLQSSGATTTGSNGLGTLNLGGEQTITINANGYRLAQAGTIAPVNFGNVLANSTQTRTITVSNTALADGFSEALNAAFGPITGSNAGSFSTSGAVTGLLAGNSNSTSMVVTLNTSSTGTKTANVQVLLDSNGNAIGNGLGLSALPTQTISLDGVITGNVGNLASAGLSPTSVNFGKFREGAANQTRQLTVSNLTTGPGEGLNASFGVATGGAGNNGGSITSLVPAGSNNTAMSVSLSGLATAGAKSGTQVLNFTSDGSFNGNVTTPLPAQTVNLSAEVYRLASTGVTSPVNLAARRVGDTAASSTLTLSNTAVADGFSEGLRGTFGAAPAGFSVSGPASTALIAAGGTESRSVTLSTASAGSFGGNVTISAVSNGSGTSGFGDAPLADKVVAVAGKVYTPAVGQSNTAAVDFGIVRVGDTVSARNISISNVAVVTALNDTLRASVGGLSGPFTPGAANVAAGTSGQVSVALNTSAAGVFTQNGNVAFTSHNADMADVGAGANAPVQVTAQVNRLANADFELLAGTGQLSDLGNGTYVLDLGSLALGSNGRWSLQIDNDVTGPADHLRGTFNLGAADDFTLGGFGDVDDLAAGQARDGLDVEFSAAHLGSFQDEVAFSGFSFNASDPGGREQGRRLLIRASVFDPNGGGNVPEPGTLALLLLAALAAAKTRAQGRRSH